ncbi:unnamed protein product [Adineta ricciae]|uniref:Uncharacterized protein n=1 Tax=Adineta ricciae TaxID=249248 RepID=A0A816BI44_ADIRI|nr:unnamed protein product [Adineta ricciae]
MQIINYLFLLLSCVPYGSSILISPCAVWNTSGITVAGTGREGSSARQLSYPQGIFVHDKSKLLYVSDSFNGRIQVFPLDRSTTNGVTLISKLLQNFKIYLDNDDDSFPTVYIAVNNADRVEKWTKGAMQGVIIGDRCKGCTGVWLDAEKNVYMTEHNRNRVLKWNRLTNTTSIVAGETDQKGPRADHLSEPQGIYVDKTTQALYIADLTNHRIQKWPNGAKEGVTVAGSSEGDPGSDAKSLDRPYGLRFDEVTKTLYIVDLLNNRIQRWKHGAAEGETLVGGNGQGGANNQFYHPTDLDFDSAGNLYVSDAWNHRVQFFALINNSPCSTPLPTTTFVNSSIRQSPIDLFLAVLLISIAMNLF